MAEEDFDIDTRVQMAGLLYKKPFGHKANKWQRRWVAALICLWSLLYKPRLECMRISDRCKNYPQLIHGD